MSKLVNHVCFVVDDSSSMGRHFQNTQSVTNKLFNEINQTGFETYISLYKFNDRVSQVMFDQLKPPAPVLNRPHGNTALLDAVGVAVNDLLTVERKARKDEDHSFLVYVITDGEENVSRSYNANRIRDLMGSLSDGWTVAIMVPNTTGVHYAKLCGFAPGNIQVWDANSNDGYEEAGLAMSASYSGYVTARASGTRGMSNLFTASAANITKADVKKNLKPVDGRIYVAQKEYQIRDFVEKMTGDKYKIGSAYYELQKTEEVQPQKSMVIVPKNNKDGVKYGGDSARSMLGLPAGTYIKVKPGDHGDWRIFIQSTSVNRKLKPGTSVFIQA